MKRVWEQDRRTVDAIVGDSKRGKNAAAAQTLDQAVRAGAAAQTLDLATATEKERAKVRAEMKEKQVKEAGELERKIEEARIEKLRATKLAEPSSLRWVMSVVQGDPGHGRDGEPLPVRTPGEFARRRGGYDLPVADAIEDRRSLNQAGQDVVRRAGRPGALPKR